MADEKDTPTDTSEDEIDAVAESHADIVVDTLDRNRGIILIGIAVLAVAVCVVLVLKQVNKQKHLEAGSAYSAAAASKEIPALDGVVVEFPGSIAAGNALLTKAEVQIDQGKSADALATLETFVADFGSHPRYSQGLFAIGNLHHVSGAADKAKEFYDKTIAEQADGELTPLSRIRLGDLSLAAGDAKVAEQHYEDSYTLHPGTPFFQMAQEKIQRLKVGNPPVVDAPKPSEPKPDPKKDAAKAAPANGKPAPGADAAATPAAKGKGKAKAKQGTTPTAKPKGKGKGKAKGKPAPAKGGQKRNNKGKAKAPATPAAPKSKGKAKAPPAAPQQPSVPPTQPKE